MTVGQLIYIAKKQKATVGVKSTRGKKNGGRKMDFLIEFSVFGLFLVLDYIVGDKRAKELKEQNEKLWNMLENLSGVNKQVLQKYTVKLVEIMNEKKNNEHRVYNYTCPNCHTILSEVENCNYCPECGTRLDLSKNE